METFHQRLARIAFEAGDELGLVLAGGYAVSAHHLTDRPSRDLDFATASPLDLPDIATDCRGRVQVMEVIASSP